jgi:hypothetical protein
VEGVSKSMGPEKKAEERRGERKAESAAFQVSLMALRPSGKWRYRVEGATRRRLATSSTVVAGSLRSVLASRRSFGERAGGLPPRRPRLRANSSPERVRSRMIERSNSARAAKMG